MVAGMLSYHDQERLTNVVEARGMTKFAWSIRGRFIRC